MAKSLSMKNNLLPVWGAWRRFVNQCKSATAIGTYVLILSALSFSACDTGDPPEEVRPLVYEGMSAEELRQTLGNPEKTEPGGTVYDANAEKTKVVEKWFYAKRTVVLIDDTVKSPNIPGQ